MSQSSTESLKLAATSVGSTFGDPEALKVLRAITSNSSSPIKNRVDALNALLSVKDKELSAVLLNLVRQPGQAVSELRLSAIRGLSQYDLPEIASTLIDAYNSLPLEEKVAAMATLCGRVHSGTALLHAIRDKKIPKEDLSADLARQLEYLDDTSVKELLEQVWGQIRKSPAEKMP